MPADILANILHTFLTVKFKKTKQNKNHQPFRKKTGDHQKID